MVVRDRRGDTPAGDLDILSARVLFDPAADTMVVTLTLAREPSDNVYYAVGFSCGQNYRQLAFKRAAGDESHIVYDAIAAVNSYDASGEASGRTVTMSAAATALGCTEAPFRLGITAEGTNGRPPQTDHVPEPGADSLNPRRLGFPSGKIGRS